jgi:MFS family permease
LRRFGSRDVLLLLLSLVLSSIPVGYLQVVLPLFLNRAGLEPGLIGVLYSVSGLVTAGLVAFSGVLADRFGRRQFLLWGTALPICSYAIFALTTIPSWLLLASVIGGVGLANGAAGAMTAASFDAMLAEHTPPRQRTTIFAVSQALWSLALAAGSLAAGLPELLRQLDPSLGDLDAYRPPFMIIILLAVIATLVLLPLRELTTSASSARAQRAGAAPADPETTRGRDWVSDTGPKQRRGWWPRRSLGVIVRYSVALGMFGLGLGIAVQLLPLWLKLRFGVDEAAMGPWYGAAQLLSLSSVIVSPWLDRRLGSGTAVMLVHVLGSLCLFAIALIAPSFEVAAVAVMARTVVANMAWPLQQALLMDRAAPEERASAAGVGFSVWGVANAVGPVFGGALIQAGSLELPIVLGGIAYALGGIAFGLGFRRGSPTGELRLVGHGSGVVGQDGHRDGRQSRDRQGDRSGVSH